MSLSTIGLYIIVIVVAVNIVIIIYRILKEIFDSLFYTAKDVRRTANQVKENRERKANVPIIVEDIINSIESYCHDMDLIHHISLEFEYSDFIIILKNGKQLTYSPRQHGFDVSNYELIAKALASRLKFTMKEVWKVWGYDNTKHLKGYVLLSDLAVKEEKEFKKKEGNRIKV